MNEPIVANNQKIKIVGNNNSIGATVASYWVGKEGILKSWETENWYTVECEGKKLLLREEEFTLIKQNEKTT